MAFPAASPFPVEPADVPDDAVRYVKHAMTRYFDRLPLDDDTARIIVAGVIAALADGGAALGAAPVLVSGYTRATGAVVAVQAARLGADRLELAHSRAVPRRSALLDVASLPESIRDQLALIGYWACPPGLRDRVDGWDDLDEAGEAVTGNDLRLMARALAR